MFYSMCIFCKENFGIVIFHLQSQKLDNFLLFFFGHFQGFEIRLWKVQEKCQDSIDALSFIYFPQRNTLQSYISSSVLKTYKKCLKKKKND